tara:strand:+ start:1520 stop:2662 length:1143 start_codon:yes stop_codon:yes gene_type:complete
MANYKTKFCKIGYSDEITTSTDPEDVCTGLGLNGNGVYRFPVSIPAKLVTSSVYTRRYFISSSSTKDTGYHDYSEGVLIDEDQHGVVGAIQVKITGLNVNFGLSEEVVTLNGQTPVVLINHYHRINNIKVISTGRSLSNEGDIYISALEGVRNSTILDLTTYVSSGVPISSQYIYAKILANDNRMLSSHYTVPRSHTLYVQSINIKTDVLSICNWTLMAGVNGSLHVVYKGVIPNTFEAQAVPNIEFKDGYAFPGGTDIVIRINTVGGTVDVSSTMEGYLISQVELELENKMRKDVVGLGAVPRVEELQEEVYRDDKYVDEEYSGVLSYDEEEIKGTYDSPDIVNTLEPPSEESFEETCEEGYSWCEVLRTCLDSSIECR